MPDTDTIPVSASVASTGPGIRYIGDHAYGYSGVITQSTSFQNYFNFTSGAGYIVADINFAGDYDELSTSNITFRIQLNQVVVFIHRWNVIILNG